MKQFLPFVALCPIILFADEYLQFADSAEQSEEVIQHPKIMVQSSSDNAQMDQMQQTVKTLQDKVAKLEKNQTKASGIPPSGRPEVKDGWNIFLMADLLYWKVEENGLEYALKAKPDDLNSFLPVHGDIKAPDFDWHLGFKLGVGWNIPYDCWDLSLVWTRINADAHGRTEAGGGIIYGIFGDSPSSAVPCAKASADWSMHFNLLDLELGREFYVGKHLTLRPHMGLRTAWIHQNYDVKYQDVIGLGPLVTSVLFNKIDFHNHFDGIGVRGGCDSQWELGAGFSVFGNVALSLLYGDIDVKRDRKQILNIDTGGVQIGPVDVKGPIKSNVHVGRAALDFVLGLKWDYMLCHERFHIGLEAGWEQHMFFGQNQLTNGVASELFVISASEKYFTSNDDLTLQGLTVAGRFDF